MEREDDPQLWDLLRHSRVPEPSPFFARNVMRALRNETSSSSTIASWFRLRRLVPTFATLAAIVIAAFTFHTMQDHRGEMGREIVTSVNVSDSDLATDLDVLSDDGDDSDDATVL